MFKKRFFLPLMIVSLLLLTVGTVLAGGWSVTTLDHLPERVIAEEPITVGFVIRQHGVTTLTDLEPIILATRCNSEETVEFNVEEDEPGHYTADVTFPSDGVWNWTIAAFGPEQPMPALTVLAADTVTTAEDSSGETTASAEIAPEDLIALGADMFVAKGCVVCHQHDDLDLKAYASINIGPELTDYTIDEVFLRRWLADPSAVKAQANMPDLDLGESEIDALIAFLGAESEEVLVSSRCDEDTAAKSK